MRWMTHVAGCFGWVGCRLREVLQPRVIVTITADTLLSRLGHGITTDHPVGGQGAYLASETEVLPAVLLSSGVLLELGRSRRVANQNQTYALIARDDRSGPRPGGSIPATPLVSARITARHVLAA